MRQGGNAVDAAIAAAITLTVVEPCSNGVGSDCFAMVWDGKGLSGLNASGKSPRAWNPAHFRKYSTFPLLGWDSVTVPGAVSGWVELSKRFGNLPFRKLFAGAIEYAERGFHVGSETADLWSRSVSTFGEFGPFRAHFLPDGNPPKVGELFTRPELADTLRELAETNGQSLYTGRLASVIAAQAEREFGLMTTEDLASHQPLWIDPISIDYNGFTVYEIPPSTQGIATLIALGILRHLELSSHPVNSSDSLARQLFAMSVAIDEAFKEVADPNCMQVDVSTLLEDQCLAQIAEQFSEQPNTNHSRRLPTSSDTVYLTAADQHGMMISMIQSNYMGFGSGVVIENTGIAMQNRGAGFTLVEGHPNQVNGSKYPYHTIIPGFMMKEQRPVLSFGVMGGHMQHQGHVQIVSRLVDHNENPQAASDAPRWHIDAQGRVFLEDGYTSDTLQAMRALGYEANFEPNKHLFGGAQLIYKFDDGYCAASDHRKEGQAAGF